MANFCTHCGTAVEDADRFCSNCGTPLRTQPQQAPTHPQAPIAQQPVVKPKIPGRGFGISSMVLGIVGLVNALSALERSSFVGSGFYYYEIFSQIISICVVSVLSILATTFAVCAVKRGYNTNIGKSGFIMGIIGLCIYALSIILAVVLYI